MAGWSGWHDDRIRGNPGANHPDDGANRWRSGWGHHGWHSTWWSADAAVAGGNQARSEAQAWLASDSRSATVAETRPSTDGPAVADRNEAMSDGESAAGSYVTADSGHVEDVTENSWHEEAEGQSRRADEVLSDDLLHLGTDHRTLVATGMASLSPSAPPLAPPVSEIGAAEAPTRPPAQPTRPPHVPALPPVGIAAAAAASETAVAAAPEVLTYDYFRALGCTHSSYKIHNQALKWFRQCAEKEGLDHVLFDNNYVQIPQLWHKHKSPCFVFNTETTTPWHWHEMVAHLRDADCEKVCQGLFVEGDDDPFGRSRGIVECRLQKTEVYDHKRHAALKKTRTPPREMLRVWNFVLQCDNGRRVCLHPNYANNTVECHREVAFDYAMPRSGPGRSDGPGTFRMYKEKHVDMCLKFDGSRAHAQPKATASRRGS